MSEPERQLLQSQQHLLHEIDTGMEGFQVALRTPQSYREHTLQSAAYSYTLSHAPDYRSQTTEPTLHITG